MAPDTQKRLERARRSLEKNKLREAVAEYQGVLEEVPSHQEALQALADIYTRLNEPGMAAPYYGMQFDRLLEVSDAAKATAIYTRFLRTFPQPSDRLMKYAALLQRQNRPSEAIEQYAAAAKAFHEQKRDIEALACYESMAVLDPENPQRHVALGELAENLRHSDLAARSFVRAGQLTQAAGALDQAIEYFEHAHQLAPTDRTGALLLAEARLRKGDAEAAVALLDPFSPNEKDTAFLALFGEGLLRTGRLDRAVECFQAYYRQKPESFVKLFETASAYMKRKEEDKAVPLIEQTKDWMRSLRKEQELCEQVDRLAAAYPASLRLAEAVAHLYEELNRETKYFDALVKLFDLYLIAGRMREACDALDRLVDIDPYDYRNQERIGQLEGKVDPGFLQNVLARAAKAATVSSSRTEGFGGAGSNAGTAAPVSEEARAQQALEDLIVQVEIFLQYSLQSKAVERLERIAQLFPGEEEKNERLRALYDRANWWPPSSSAGGKASGNGAHSGPSKPPVVPAAVPPIAVSSAPSTQEPVPVPAAMAVASAVDTHRDLAMIAEINRLMYRQSTPREVLATTAAQVGKHLGVARCLVSVGGSLDGGHLTAEFCAPGFQSASVAHAPALIHLVTNAPADGLGGVELLAANVPVLKELGLETALGVVLTDKETQAVAGTLIVGDQGARKWKPNESFFLQAVGDQLVMSVNHTRLRSLVRSLAVADEKTGLLSRGAYVDCLLVEANRSRAQNTHLSLIILHVDHGNEILRQHGDSAVDKYMEQVARALSSTIRQTDIGVKYTAWSLAFILPDTSVENAKILAEKLKKAAASVRPSWDGKDLTMSAIVAEASSRPGDETEDRVTEWINRAEYGIEDLRQGAGGQLVALATP